MPVPFLALSAEPAAGITADVLVLGVRQGAEELPELLAGTGVELGLDLASIGVTGGKDQLVRLPAPAGVAASSVALIGVGGGEPTPEMLRYAAGSVTRQLRGAPSIAFALPAPTDETALALLEGAALGAYSYDDYRVDSKKSAQAPASRITVLAAAANADALVGRAAATATAVFTVRDLVNTPPSDLYPASFAARARELADSVDVTFEEWDEEALARDGYGGILGVGLGSTRPPRLVQVSYAPEGASAHLALVGKGITFDSGGLSLKPAASMVGMKYDMTGAATALAVTLAAARLTLPVRITAWLCLAENMPSGSAARPNDVLRIFGGKTVEVLNTDAEGRLVLADGLVAASETQPDAIVDIATLTGAATVALGTRYVAVMGEDEPVERFLTAATATGEPAWHMPLPGELRAVLNSDIADIANAKPGNTAAGMLLAGVFLKDFVGKRPDGTSIPWVHLDIAGTANNQGPSYGWSGRGPTGVTVRALLAFAENMASGA